MSRIAKSLYDRYGLDLDSEDVDELEGKLEYLKKCREGDKERLAEAKEELRRAVDSMSVGVSYMLKHNEDPEKLNYKLNDYITHIRIANEGVHKAEQDLADRKAVIAEIVFRLNQIEVNKMING